MLRTHLIVALVVAVAGVFVGCNTGGGGSSSTAAKAAAAAASGRSTGGSATPSTPPTVTVKDKHLKFWKARDGYYVQKDGKTTFVPRRN